MRLSKNRHAVVIGTGHYNPGAGVKDIPFAINDAKTVARLLRDPGVGQIPELQVTLILDENSQLIRSKLEKVFMNASYDDLVLVYVSSHGDKTKSGKLRLLTHDSSPDSPLTHSLPISFIKQLMEESPSRNQVLILDCCYSGAIEKDLVKSEEKDEDRFSLDELSAGGRYIMAATSSLLYAYPESDQKYSWFTYYLIEGLRTKEADSEPDGLISLDELFAYIAPKVKEATKNKQQPRKWGLDVAGEIYIAQGRKDVNPLITGLKLSPEETLKKISDWRIDKFSVDNGKTPEYPLMTTPILTRKEVEHCYVASQGVKSILENPELINPQSIWFFVSPQGTGKTSMLTYFASELSSKVGCPNFVKINRVPADPDISIFLSSLKSAVDAPSEECVAIFDGTILEGGSTQLLSKIKESMLEMPVWITCSETELAQLLSMAPELENELLVQNLPGYLDTDKKYFQEFIELKFEGLLGEAERLALLERKEVVMSSICNDYYYAKLYGNISRGVESIDAQIKRQFYSMSRSAQLLARTIQSFSPLSHDIIELMIENSDLFSAEDYDAIINQQFVFLESGGSGLSSDIVNPSARMKDLGEAGLFPHDRSQILELIMGLAETEENVVKLTILIEVLEKFGDDLDATQTMRIDQFGRRAEGGQICQICNVYHSSKLKWCPTCGREFLEEIGGEEDLAKINFGENIESVPFPRKPYYKDVKRPEFDWSRVDLSTFDD